MDSIFYQHQPLVHYCSTNTIPKQAVQQCINLIRLIHKNIYKKNFMKLLNIFYNSFTPHQQLGFYKLSVLDIPYWSMHATNLGGLIGVYGFQALSRMGVLMPSWIGVAEAKYEEKY